MLRKQNIPFKILKLDPGNFHIYVTLKISNQYFNFLIDTGASQCVLDYHFEHLIRKDSTCEKKSYLEPGYSINTEIKEFGSGYISRVYHGSVKIEDLHVILIDLDYINNLYRKYSDVKINGLIGCDFLVKYDAIIDFKTKNVVLCNV